MEDKRIESAQCRVCEYNSLCYMFGKPTYDCRGSIKEAKQKAHELVVSAIRTETAREIFDWLKSKQLMISEIPEEGKPYQFLGCYITKWGKTDEPTLGLVRLMEDDEYKELKLKYGVFE